jgi:sortase (surface protein transpeptidase)
VTLVAPPAAPAPARPASPVGRRRLSDVVRLFISGLGQLLVTLAVIVALLVVYEDFVSDLFSNQAQANLSEQLREEWTAQQPVTATIPPPMTAPRVGEPFAFLHIPRLAIDFDRAVVEGTEQEQLAQGPGHYVGTAMPGQPGNFAVAGHRVGKGSPFLDVDTLRPGDPIVVETEKAWYTYRVIGDSTTGEFLPDGNSVPGREVVTPRDVSVIAPTPRGPMTAAPTGAYLTLTTCNPKFSAQTRLVIHAVLDGAPLTKASAPSGPAALRQHSS